MGRSGRSGGGRSSGGSSGGGRPSGGFSSGSRSSNRSYGYHSNSYHTRYGSSYRPVFINSRPLFRSSILPFGGPWGTFVQSGLVVVVILSIMFVLMKPSPSVKSTVEREPLPLSASQETAYLKDSMGWFSNKNAVEKSLKYFAEQTGVRPYLYITDGTEGSEFSELSESSQRVYDEICSDEAHFVFLFYDDGNGNYECGYTVGAQAKTVMDDEAVAILADYLDRYYHSDLNDEQVFAKTFAKTADRIMTVTKSPVVTIMTFLIPAAAIVLLVGIIAKTVIKKKALAVKEAEATAEILNAPIESLGSSELNDLEKKYTK